MNSMDPDHTTDAPTRTTNCRLSKQQKTMLQRLMDTPLPQEGRFSLDSTLKLWPKVANQLNKIPGARKTWMQWRQTWRDIKKNSKKSQLPNDSDKFTDLEWSISDDSVSNDKVWNSTAAKAVHNGADDKKVIRTKGLRTMSRDQRKLLYKLVNSNAMLQKEKFDDPSSSSSAKTQQEWQKIATKLNSVSGSLKTWLQWKKCWYANQERYVRRNDQFSDSSGDVDTDNDAGITTRRCKDRNEIFACTPSATQLNCLVKQIEEHRNEGKRMWNDHKSKLQKLIAKNGTGHSNSLQRLTYECIKRAGNRNDAASSILMKQQRSADHECNIVGNLVAVKLRSMEKEQKLIAEKLISEILFQGQMEMFQYSEEAVNIPGYF